MSGKGKGKGKGKRKDKPKPHEIELFNKRIDSKRLAYDVIKYTAIRFRVPESCIAVWKDKCNDYESEDFLFIFCMRIMLQQLKHRGRCHIYFSLRYEQNKLAEPRLISELLYDVVKEITCDFKKSPLLIVETSLSIACELFLFLYSKDMDLNPKKLATNWFDCYLNINKKAFENAGGLKDIYCTTIKEKCLIMHAFLDKFIEDYCLPYDISAINPNLDLILAILMDDSIPQRKREVMLKELALPDHLANQMKGVKIKEPSGTDEATGSNPSESTVDQTSQASASSAASSQEVPATSPEEKPWSHSTLSKEERRKKDMVQN